MNESAGRVLVYGTGRLTQAMVPAFAAAWPRYETAIMGRSQAALATILDAHPCLSAGGAAFAERCDLVMLAVSPDACGTVLEVLSPHLSPSAIVLSVTNAVTLDDVARWTANPVVKAVPTIAQSVGAGAIPVVAGPGAKDDHVSFVSDWLGQFGSPVVVSESDIRIASNVAGSAIAAVAEFARAFVSANEPHAEAIGRAALESMMAETLIAVGELYRSGTGFEQARRSTATPGGVTEALMQPLDAVIAETCRRMVSESMRRQASLQAASGHRR